MMNFGVHVGDSYDYELTNILSRYHTTFVGYMFYKFVASPSIHPVLQLPPVLGQISLHVIFKTFMAESDSRSQVLLHLSQGLKTGSLLALNCKKPFFWFTIFQATQKKT